MEGLTHIRAAIVAAHRAIACERAAAGDVEGAKLWLQIAGIEHRKKRAALARWRTTNGVATPPRYDRYGVRPAHVLWRAPMSSRIGICGRDQDVDHAAAFCLAANSAALRTSRSRSGNAEMISGQTVRGSLSRNFIMRTAVGSMPIAPANAAGPPLSSMICAGVLMTKDVTTGYVAAASLS